MQYTSPEQIVAAYDEAWQVGKERFVAAKQKQEQLDRQIRNQQVAHIINNELSEGAIKK